MQTSSSLASQLRILVRWKWNVLAFVVIVPAVAVAFSLQQSKLYEASAQVLLKNQNLASTLVGITDTSSQDTPDRQAQTEAGLARVPDVAKRVLNVTHTTDVTVNDFLNSSSVDVVSNANLLEFKVTMPTETQAARLATAYAAQYTAYKKQLDTAAINKAEQDVTASLTRLGPNAASSSLYSSLLKTQQDLKTLAALQTSNAILVKRASSAVQVRPRPVRTAALSLVLGLLLGCGVAFLANALDTRVTEEEIAEYYGAPLIGRLPKPPAAVRRADTLVMLDAPFSAGAEAYRLIQTNLDFVRVTHPASAIMVTSALDSEGKSPLAANLAFLYARSGKRVALVDLDLRRPAVAKLLALPNLTGLTDIALGTETLSSTLRAVPTDPAAWRGGAWAKQPHQAAKSDGDALYVLTAGKVPPNPSEIVASAMVVKIIAKLREITDLIIVDAPPLLAVADPLLISRTVDAIVVVARQHSLRRHAATEGGRLLKTSPAPTLGFVLVDAGVESSAYYRYNEHGSRERS
jgi:Mrp family chromosome partitioning ATPase/capsular polysaccharide biosynthesis protein